MGKAWPALIVRATEIAGVEDTLSLLLDDLSPAAIEDLADRPLPAGGLWDPTYPPIPEPPPTPPHWRVFFCTAEARSEAIRVIASALPGVELVAVDVPDEDWAARSQRSLTAVTAGRFVVAPPWDLPPSLPANRILIVIEPSMGFGTGHHPTTRLCLRLLSSLDLAGRSVLDLGTGSGVLAMAASLAGARSVVGVDVDPDAIGSAEASALLNPLPQTLSFRVTDFRTTAVGDADVVLANLTAGMLTSAGGAIRALVRKDGALIVSGFDHTEVDAVIRAYEGLDVEEQLTEDGWVALRFGPTGR